MDNYVYVLTRLEGIVNGHHMQLETECECKHSSCLLYRVVSAVTITYWTSERSALDNNVPLQWPHQRWPVRCRHSHSWHQQKFNSVPHRHLSPRCLHPLLHWLVGNWPPHRPQWGTRLPLEYPSSERHCYGCLVRSCFLVPQVGESWLFDCMRSGSQSYRPKTKGCMM